MAKFVVATPNRSVCDNHARALEQVGKLRFLALGTRRGTEGIPPEHTRLNPWVGLLAYAGARTLGAYQAEALRFRLYPWFDHWVKKQLVPGDHIISSFGNANASFRWVRQHGGKTFLDGGNSHPAYFWELLTEEHRRWKCHTPPVAPYHYERSLAMMDEVDYVLSPSRFVTQSFLKHGFCEEQILPGIYPLNLELFKPSQHRRPADRPLTLISTGSLSLRKGTPYLLEAFRIVRKAIPQVRLLLTDLVFDSVRPILAQYSDLPIEWAPSLPHAELAERLRSADLYIMPSLEEGLARTLTEALACGLPIITTPNSGVNDYVVEGENGSVVPIRDAKAIANAVFAWADRVQDDSWEPRALIDPQLFSQEGFSRNFLAQMRGLGLLDE